MARIVAKGFILTRTKPNSTYERKEYYTTDVQGRWKTGTFHSLGVKLFRLTDAINISQFDVGYKYHIERAVMKEQVCREEWGDQA